MLPPASSERASRPAARGLATNKTSNRATNNNNNDNNNKLGWNDNKHIDSTGVCEINTRLDVAHVLKVPTPLPEFRG